MYTLGLKWAIENCYCCTKSMCSLKFCWIIYAWPCMWDVLKSKKTWCGMKYWWLEFNKQIKMTVCVCVINVTKNGLTSYIIASSWFCIFEQQALQVCLIFLGASKARYVNWHPLGSHYVILSCQWCLHYFWYNSCLLLMSMMILYVNVLHFTSNMKTFSGFVLLEILGGFFFFFFTYFVHDGTFHPGVDEGHSISLFPSDSWFLQFCLLWVLFLNMHSYNHDFNHRNKMTLEPQYFIDNCSCC